MPEPSDGYERHQVLDFAVRNFLNQEGITEGEEVEIRIFVTNIRNDPIHEYRVERAGG
jgi:hypothetical protein